MSGALFFKLTSVSGKKKWTRIFRVCYVLCILIIFFLFLINVMSCMRNGSFLYGAVLTCAIRIDCHGKVFDVVRA